MRLVQKTETRSTNTISAQTMKKALPTFKNKPILAYIHKIENEDGEMEEVFGWHAMHEDEEGNTVYDERMVGIIPESSSPTLKYDEDKNKYYVNIDGFIYEEYSHAKDILERNKESISSFAENCKYWLRCQGWFGNYFSWKYSSIFRILSVCI